MKEHKAIEVLTIEQASKVARTDAATQSKDVKAYIESNTLTYYILINTWVILWKNFAVHAWHRFLSFITEKGLIPAIAEMQAEAMRVLTSEDWGPWATVLFSELRLTRAQTDETLYEGLIGRDDTATVLFLLRYPKRFSPNNNDIIKENTLKDFIQYENRTKMLQLSSSYAYWHYVCRVKGIIANMYDWDAICESIDNMSIHDIIFSSGSARDASPALGNKVMAIANDGNCADYILPIFGQYVLPRYACHEEGPRVSKVIAVPKSYKSSRIIAMEDTLPIAVGKRIEMIFRAHDKSDGTGINIEDQTVNQILAAEGSSSGDLATLDASHASDLISKSLFIDVFPTEYTRRVLPLLPVYVDVNGQRRVLHMASTSGHTLTFRHETIVYTAIARAALDIATDLGIECKRPTAVAYGDDTVISSEAAEIACHIFSRLGLIINTDKSYWSGVYRESCGKDYLNGVDVTSIYYPRFPVIGTITENKVTLAATVFNDEYRGKLDNALTMLIDLQKKLFPYSYDCARFLASIINCAYPSITTSVAGTVCNDMWDYVDNGKSIKPTAWELQVVDPKSRSAGSKFVKLEFDKLPLHGDTLRAILRLAELDRRHVAPGTSYQCTKTQFTPSEQKVYEYWKYQYFLQHGPRYEDSLMELLGVSQKPMPISEFFGKRTLVLKKN